MPTTLKRLLPVARKGHACNFCGCTIAPGTKYCRDTLVYDGCVYDWVSHQECQEAASRLRMYDDCDDNGLGPDEFSENVWSYLYDCFRDVETDDIPEELRRMDCFARVRFILDTWNRLDVKLHRKRNALAYVRRIAAERHSRDRYAERIAALEAEIAALEKGGAV